MEKINIKHIFIGIILVFIVSFLNMCNSCSTKKELKKVKVELSVVKDSLDLTKSTIDAMSAKQVTGYEVMQLYLNTAVNSPRTLEQIQKDSVLTKIMKK